MTRTTLTVDEIPAIPAGTLEGQPPGRLVHFDADGSILVDGHTLVSIRGESRAVEVTRNRQVAWEMSGYDYPAKA